MFRRVWYFVASINFRSTEAFADYLNEPSALEKLAGLVLLPFTPKQRRMIGEERFRDSVNAQIESRGLQRPNPKAIPAKPMSYFTSEIHTDRDCSSAEWAQSAVEQVFSATKKSGNHVCKNEVCHKGRIGKQGFCRMFFWHWCRYVDEKKCPQAKRCHGLQLQKRWNGLGTPPIHATQPFTGLPAVEINHPFHIKMTPSMFLGPTCNHDLGVLLRVCADSGMTKEQAVNSILDAMGDR